MILTTLDCVGAAFGLLNGYSVLFSYLTLVVVYGGGLAIYLLVLGLIRISPSGIGVWIGRVFGAGRWQFAVGIAAAAVLGTSGWWLDDAEQIAAYRAAPSCPGPQAGQTDCRYTLQAEVASAGVARWAWIGVLFAAVAAFGFLRWSVRRRSGAEFHEMAAARFVRPELVTVLCFGLGLTLMNSDVTWGIPALLVGLAVLVYSSVRLPAPTTG